MNTIYLMILRAEYKQLKNNLTIEKIPKYAETFVRMFRIWKWCRFSHESSKQYDFETVQKFQNKLCVNAMNLHTCRCVGLYKAFKS